MAFVRQLAESVMCGARADCAAAFDANLDGGAEQRAAELEAADDPLWLAALNAPLPPESTAPVTLPERRSKRRARLDR
jgi:hypothetical protein